MHKILVVEDEIRINLALRSTLKSKGYLTFGAFNSEQALKAFNKNKIDLVILDVMLPNDKYDGMDLIKILRTNNPDISIIMLTALGEIKNKVKGLKLGADDYLAKPFDMNELLIRVAKVLKRPKVNLGPILTVRDLELDPANLEVKRDSKKIKLSNKEYRLLAFLMYNQGQIVSKEKIIKHLWNDDQVVVDNTVEVYIGYLRTKIDKNFPKLIPLIHTIRGFGYKLS